MSKGPGPSAFLKLDADKVESQQHVLLILVGGRQCSSTCFLASYLNNL